MVNLPRLSGSSARSAAIALVAALAVSHAAAQPAYTFTKIVEGQSRDPVYFSPAVNNSGAVAFVRRDAGSPVEVLISQGGVTTKIADSAGPLSGVGSSLDLNDAGTVVFFANLDAGGRGIFTGNGGPLATIITTDDESPLGGAFTGLHSPSINASGAVSFMGQVGARRGIFKFDNGAVATVVDDSGPLKDFGFSASPINDDGLVAFSAAFDDRPLIQGVFTSAGNGSFTTIAEGGHEEVLTASSINSAGTLAFHNFRGIGFGGGIYTGSGGLVQTVIERNDTFTDGLGNFPSINSSGLVAFLTFNAQPGPGIFTGPNADKMIEQGDPLFGSTVRNVNISSSSLNDLGQIAFTYFLEDGRRGVVLATPVPEPSAIFLICLAFLQFSSIPSILPRAFALKSQVPSCKFL